MLKRRLATCVVATSVVLLAACGGRSSSVTTASEHAALAQGTTQSSGSVASTSGSTPELVVPDSYRVYLVGTFRGDVNEQQRSAFVEQLLSSADRQTSPYAAQYRANEGRLELSWPNTRTDNDLATMQKKLDQSGLFVSVSRVNG